MFGHWLAPLKRELSTTLSREAHVFTYYHKKVKVDKAYLSPFTSVKVIVKKN